MSALQELYPGLYNWVTVVQMEQMKVPLGGLYLVQGEHRVLIDPPLPEGGFEAIEAHGKPTAIVLTSDSHERDSAKFQERYGVPVYIHESMGGKLEEVKDARTFKGQGEDLVATGLQAIDLPGLEETALLLATGGGLLLLGDAIVDMGEGPQPLPAQWVRNPSGYAEDLKKLNALNFAALWLSHGGLIKDGAKEKVYTVCKAQEAAIKAPSAT